MEDSSQGWTQLGPFFPKSGHFFRFPQITLYHFHQTIFSFKAVTFA